MRRRRRLDADGIHRVQLLRRRPGRSGRRSRRSPSCRCRRTRSSPSRWSSAPSTPSRSSSWSATSAWGSSGATGGARSICPPARASSCGAPSVPCGSRACIRPPSPIVSCASSGCPVEGWRGPTARTAPASTGRRRVIEEMRLRDLGVIAEATLPIGPGFTAITGETGAGKTMVVTGLGLLMGQRADSGAVRSGAAQASVDGVWLVPSDGVVVDRVREAGGDVEPVGDGRAELVLGRTISSEGRSRATVGGRSAPAGVLADLADAARRRARPVRSAAAAFGRAQRDALDRFGGVPVADAWPPIATAFERLRAIERELSRSPPTATRGRARRRTCARRSPRSSRRRRSRARTWSSLRARSASPTPKRSGSRPRPLTRRSRARATSLDVWRCSPRRAASWSARAIPAWTSWRRRPPTSATGPRTSPAALAGLSRGSRRDRPARARGRRGASGGAGRRSSARTAALDAAIALLETGSARLPNSMTTAIASSG